MAPINLDPEELIANYKPLPQLDIKKKKTFDDIDPLAKIMKTKNMRYFIFLYNVLLIFYNFKYSFVFYRTKVYSGNKSTIYTEVPKLLDFCIQTIKDNLDGKYILFT